MAYRNGSVARAVLVATVNAARPAYLRRIAKASLDFDLDRAARHVTRMAPETIYQGPEELRIPACGHTWGQSPIVDLVALCALVRSCAPRRLFEFGTFTGNATCAMVANAPADSRLLTLDLPPGARGGVIGLNWEAEIDDSVIGRQFHGSLYEPRITQLFGDSRTFDTAPYCASMDFVWIDACHEYDFVRGDSIKAFEMLAPGGIVAWHDFSRACPGVLRYIIELARQREVRWVEGTQVVFCRG